MATQKLVDTQDKTDLTDVLEAEQAEFRTRLMTSLDQARRGQLAEGSGEDAIRRAFALSRAEAKR